ncbi:MarR family winged helix-turn-helix transcriptional regulator [Caulobacter sp. S45]|jgi:DNA-binding MarR family transcriptional regulator|uniref:MarR family winged helix-turn-helix transcriptional regulator n=1 Tax=Caulobacter sp. S45 TaxID=1641861 RepID=UPI00131EA114|nr:MarR family transcriptional regulator [Caulobacter sp. S45]
MKAPDPDLVPEPLDAVVGYLLRRAHGLFALHWQLTFRGSELPITPVQGGMMVMIDKRDGLTQAALARIMNVEGPTLLQSLDRLEQHGYVLRTRRPEDRRSHSLSLTPRGRQVLAEVMAFLPRRDDALLQGLSAEERRTLIDLLSRVISSGQSEVKSLQKAEAPTRRAATAKPEAEALT